MCGDDCSKTWRPTGARQTRPDQTRTLIWVCGPERLSLFLHLVRIAHWHHAHVMLPTLHCSEAKYFNWPLRGLLTYVCYILYPVHEPHLYWYKCIYTDQEEYLSLDFVSKLSSSDIKDIVSEQKHKHEHHHPLNACRLLLLPATQFTH
ncbi:hypothetical protein TWF506_010151 [Arthrobotrys conoides]|uniref:Uncharacterized protein n=1 Tax=Arthrobotrys conoides TaxID=74498 RepID=A0AAN8N3F8_9PEZI